MQNGPLEETGTNDTLMPDRGGEKLYTLVIEKISELQYDACFGNKSQQRFLKAIFKYSVILI